MFETNNFKAVTKELIEDMKQIVKDADAFLQSTTDHTSENVANLLTRIQEKLKVAQNRLAEFESSLIDKTTETTHEMLQKSLKAINHTIEVTKEAVQKAEGEVKKTAASGKEVAQHTADAAKDAAKKAVVTTREAATKVLTMIEDWLN